MKIGLVSLGCPKNLVDGEVMLGLARDAGHEITPDAQSAEVIVVNTCAFIDNAKEESIDAILDVARLKREGSCKSLIVTGCLAERYRDALKREIPEIDVCLGTGEVPGIVGAISGSVSPVRLFRSRRQLTYLYDASTPRVLTTPRHYAYAKIAEGCDYTCAFCIIPTLRGNYRSRDDDSIVREAEQLAAGGVRELLLISQDTTFFGIDRRLRAEGVSASLAGASAEAGGLARLLRRLNLVDGLEWIRLLYLYPTTVSDDVLDAIAECDKVCRYIDLPLQHASASVLRRMRRPGNRQTYDKLLARIRRRIPDVALRTTFIVGFPGETTRDFDELRAFVRDTAFDHVGVFTYSHEEGTRAFSMPDDVPQATKRARRQNLMELQKEIVRRRQRSRIGERVRVMIDGPSPESPLVLQGRLEGQAPDIDPVVYLDGCDPSEFSPGQVIPATLIGAKDYDLIAAPTLARSGTATAGA